MSDEFPICSGCGKIDTLRNITGIFPQVWKKEELEEIEKNWLWCVKCKMIISKKGLKHISSEVY